ncbi:MAG: F0F1 ATP synthase subunit B [Gemmatimonadaceae bacterium]|nr:F0F1 ATP synthase subunit B [Gemmatimonadaceae bacterium]
MRSSLIRALTLVAVTALPAFASEAEAPKGGLLTPQGGLMFWTLIVFGVLFFVLSKFAFKPILAAVEGREQALRDAMDEAKADRELAAQLLAEQKQALEAARTDAQKIIADGRATADKMRADLLEQTRAQQTDMLERAKRDIEAEKHGAIAELRREAVDLAIAGASKVIEKNLDDAANRALIDKYLASIGTK